MKNVFGVGAAGVVFTVLAVGSAATASAQEENDGYPESDAGPLGVETVDVEAVYCAADAGSLDHPDPTNACRR